MPKRKGKGKGFANKRNDKRAVQLPLNLRKKQGKTSQRISFEVVRTGLETAFPEIFLSGEKLRQFRELPKKSKRINFNKFERNVLQVASPRVLKQVLGFLVERNGLIKGRIRELEHQRTHKARKELRKLTAKQKIIDELYLVVNSLLKSKN